MNMMKYLSLLLITAVIIYAGGCGDNNDDNDTTGSLNLYVTDAPVDNAFRVVVEFAGVEIQSSSGDRTDFDFSSPKQIDLLSLNSVGSAVILDNETLPSGDYDWIRLKVNAECDVIDSYIEINNVTHSIWIPSGNQSGLKLVSGFHLPAEGVADFTIDFDLRKSVNNPQGQGNCSGNYKLKPALRIVNNTEVGSITGIVDPALINASGCTGGNIVYVFQGHDIVPDDIDDITPDPVTSAIVKLDAMGDYVYRASFLSAGDYSVAFTCQGDDDDPEADDSIDFTGAANVSVNAGLVAIHNF